MVWDAGAIATVMAYGANALLITALSVFWIVHYKNPFGKMLAVAGVVQGLSSSYNFFSHLLDGVPAGLLATLTWGEYFVMPLLMVVLWFYPIRIKPRSLEAAAFWLALSLAAGRGLIWIFARDWQPASDNILRWLFVDRWAAVAVASLVVIFQLARYYRFGGREGRGLVLHSSFIAAGAYATVTEALVWSSASAVGIPAPWPLPQFMRALADPFGIAPTAFILVRVLAVALIAYHAWKRNFVPVAVFGAVLALTVVDLFSSIAFLGLSFGLISLPVSYITIRYGVYGASVPPRTLKIFAWFVGTLTPFPFMSGILQLGPQNPFIIIASIVVPGAVGAAAVYWLQPERVYRPFGKGMSSDTDTRLDPYHSVLLQEIQAGTSRDQRFERLRSLRVTLGVSDQEHAVLEYAAERGATPALAAGRLRPGEKFLSRYRVERLLGQGGLGVTHLCVDERVQRNVVIKTIRADSGMRNLDALLKEARALGRVDHPNVVTLLDADRVGDEAFVVMEFLPGGSLADRLQAGPLRGDDWTGLANDVLAGLAAVHAQGLVHRDVKPSNILLTKGGRAKVADFGVAHIPGFETTVAAGPFQDAVGTVRYMSPEQARARSIGPSSDLYSAGLVLFEAMNGTPYHGVKEAETAVELRLRIARSGVFNRTLGASPKLYAWWKKALHPVAASRFQSAEEMQRGLAQALKSPVRVWPRPRFTAQPVAT